MRPAAQYWWIVADWNGKSVVIGPANSQEEANRMGYEKLDTQFNVVTLPTRDRGRATAMLKARKLQDGAGLNAALEKMRHKIPKQEP